MVEYEAPSLTGCIKAKSLRPLLVTRATDVITWQLQHTFRSLRLSRAKWMTGVEELRGLKTKLCGEEDSVASHHCEHADLL